MNPISLEEMRSQYCPRISGKDVLDSFKKKKSLKLLLIDIRPAIEFQLFNIKKSKNIPFDNVNFTKLSQTLAQTTVQLSTANENDTMNYLIYLLQKKKDANKVVIGSQSKMNLAIEFANKLVQLKMSKVCILNNGVECFQSTLELVNQS
jgi:hypothetical protein